MGCERWERGSSTCKRKGMAKDMYQGLKFTLTAILLLVISAGCQSLEDVSQIYQESKEVVGAVVTLARGVSTQHPGLLETAGAFVVEEGQNLGSTAQAFATQNPGLLETARALAEERGPSVLGTAQAFATDQPALVQTARALLPGGSSPKSPLEDIPVITSPIDIHYSTPQYLSYSTEGAYQDTVNFYKLEMPANGWEPDYQRTFEEAYMSSLVYTQPGRKASITISFSDATGRTLVVILSDEG